MEAWFGGLVWFGFEFDFTLAGFSLGWLHILLKISVKCQFKCLIGNRTQTALTALTRTTVSIEVVCEICKRIAIVFNH